jgi:hypothetical protein
MCNSVSRRLDAFCAPIAWSAFLENPILPGSAWGTEAEEGGASPSAEFYNFHNSGTSDAVFKGEQRRKPAAPKNGPPSIAST